MKYGMSYIHVQLSFWEVVYFVYICNGYIYE